MKKLRVNLFSGEESDISKVMDGAWEDIQVEELGADPRVLVSDDVEYCCFVIDGNCRLTNSDGIVFDLIPDSAFALPKGGKVSLTAVDTARLLIISMRLGV